MLTIKTPKNSKKLICETCDFKCSNKQDYNRHLSTRKHKMLTDVDINVDNLVPKNAKAFTCECGKEYKYRQSLSVHKKKCKKNSKEPIENTLVISKQDLVTEEEPTEKQLMMTIIKQNGETCTTKWRNLCKKMENLLKLYKKLFPKLAILPTIPIVIIPLMCKCF